MNADGICRRYFISGRVQAVCYRVATQEQAAQLGLTGWVRNLRDGRVEVLACGSESQHQNMKNWLGIGPPQAKVSTIEVLEATFERFGQFEIRDTASIN